MTRVNLTIRRLVVHGRGEFDTEEFSAALRSEVARRIGEGKTLSVADQGRNEHSRPRNSGGRGEHDIAAQVVARRLFR